MVKSFTCVGLYLLFLALNSGLELTHANDTQACGSLITVSGEAEILVVPDEIVFRLTVQTEGTDPKDALIRNNDHIQRIINAAKNFGIRQNDIQTSHIGLYPRREYDRIPDIFKYQFTKSIEITLRDVTLFSQLFPLLVEYGANSAWGVTYRTSDLRKHKDRARILAIQAAKEKATALTHELGQTIGKAMSIREETPSYSWYSESRANVTVNSGGEPSPSNDSFAVGQIKVTAKITVSFELQ